MKDATAEKFADYASGITFDDLTPSALHAIKRSLVDSIGCGLGAFNSDSAIAVRKFVSRVSSTEPATILGTATKTSAEYAALANGTAIRYSDFSDDYFGGNGSTGPHPSDNLGGMLAVAESVGAGPRVALLGIAIAYEASGQLVDLTSLGQESGWDYTIFHSVGSALGAANILGLSPEQTLNALGLAVVPNVSMRETREGQISNWKAVAGPNGSRAGILAALLARDGLSGPPRPFEGSAGFMKQLHCPFELGALGGGSVPFKIEGTYMKATPVRYTLQLPVWIAQEVRKQVALDDVESVVLYIAKRFAVGRDTHPAQWDPTTRETADHSGPYLVGEAFVHGEITPETYTEAHYRDPKTLAFVAKVEMREDPEYTKLFPTTFKCRIEATLRSGEVITVEELNPKGHPGNPMSDDDITTKFRRQASTVLEGENIDRLGELLWNFENVKAIGEIFEPAIVTKTA